MRDIRDDIAKNTPYYLKDALVKPAEIFDYLVSVSAAIEYFRELGPTEIKADQVATFFEALVHQGMYQTEASDEAKLPEYPQWLL